MDVANEIHGNFGDTRSWSFSFAFRDPSVRTEEVGAINLNKLRRDGGDYADTHARYDHVTVNQLADISDGSGRKGVTLSNPDLAFARLGRSTVSTLDTATPQIHFLAGGQVDGPALGIPAQNGNQRFLQRFALRPHGGYSAVAAMKFALEHQNPLVTGRVTGSQPAYPAKAHSLLTLSHSNVLLWALKPHDDGIEAGLVARVWNLSDQPATTRFRGVKPFSGVRRLTHVETPIEDLPVTDGVFETVIGPQRMETFGW